MESTQDLFILIHKKRHLVNVAWFLNFHYSTLSVVTGELLGFVDQSLWKAKEIKNYWSFIVNRYSGREKGMASNLKMDYRTFFIIPSWNPNN